MIIVIVLGVKVSDSASFDGGGNLPPANLPKSSYVSHPHLFLGLLLGIFPLQLFLAAHVEFAVICNTRLLRSSNKTASRLSFFIAKRSFAQPIWRWHWLIIINKLHCLLT